MLTGWMQLNGIYYYLHTDGRMLTGWLNDGTNQYYMDPSGGNMSVGWKQIDGKWYYFNNTGHMQKGWINIDGRSYYLNESNGQMLAGGTYTIGGGSYSFDQNGVCTNQGASSYGTNFTGNQQTANGGFTNTVYNGPGSTCLLYTSPSPRDLSTSRMPSSA